MPRPLSQELDAAVHEVECVKAALSCTKSDSDGDKSYLGMRGHVESDRASLLQVLRMTMQQLDRLREKEIEFLKASTAAAAPAGRASTGGQCNAPCTVGPPPSTAAGFSEIGAGDEAAGERRKLSDVRTWVSCRALLDSVGVGELRVVDFPVPRAELSVTVDALHLFEWPSPPGGLHGSGTAGVGSTAAAGAIIGEPERAGLVAYLNAVLGPGVGNEWVVPHAATAATGDNTDFLSIPTGRSWRRRSGSAAAAAAAAAAVGGEVLSSRNGDTIHGGAPSAAMCISEAVKSGAPSLGLRVILEIVHPAAAAAVAAAPGAHASTLSNGGSVTKGGSGGGAVFSSRAAAAAAAAAGGASGQAALYRAIAVLVAANRRSPLTRPVVVLTDLQGSWKLLWLGGASSGVARSREDGDTGWEPAAAATAAVRVEEASNHYAATMTAVTVDGDDVDVFVWRMGAADAASVIRSMLHEEAVDWDGQVSWASPRRSAPAAAPAGPGEGERELHGPMASLRDRHLVGRRCRQRHHYPRRESSTAADPTVAINGDAEAVEEFIPHAMSPPLAMEMALRMGGSSSFTGQSFGQRTTAGASLGGAGTEDQVRESRSFSGGVERALGELGARDDMYSLDGRRRRGNSCHHSVNGSHSVQSANVQHLVNGGGYAHNNPSPGDYLGAGFLGSSPRANGGGGSNTNGSQSRSVSPPSPPTITLGGSPLAGAGSDLTILRHLIPFAAGEGFLFVAGVSKSWREAWGVERTPGTTIDAAVQSPSRLGWARASGLNWGSNVCARAAAGGYLSTLRYARAVGCPWDWKTCANAATRTLVPVASMIPWAASKPAPSSSPSSSVPDNPPRSRRLQVLQWCKRNGCPWDEATTYEAAREGDLDILRYARANGCPWNVLTCAYAAAAGHLETVKWARAEGCDWNEATCAFAAAGGHLEVLKWARAEGCPWGEETCASAARGGRLEVLKWARRNGCPWGGGTCANAAEGGHLDVLQWARGERCPWTEATCTLAARGGQFEVLKWARENGCSWASSTFRAAAGVGNLEMLRFLFDEGCPWDRRTCATAAKNSDLEALKWLRMKGCPWDSRTLDAAAEVGAMDVFEWATSNRCPS